MGAHGKSESAFVFALERKEDSWGLGGGGGGDWSSDVCSSDLLGER